MERVKLLDTPKWTEARVGIILAHQLLNSRSVLVVPNCNWTGYECDLLVVERGLRIIDVEIKISRADLRADIKKDKWWAARPWSRAASRAYRETGVPPVRDKREWPEKVWKHYYAIPAAIWTDQLLDAIPANSGVILLNEPSKGHYRGDWMRIPRRAKPNKEAKAITSADAIDLARLASLRMWTALTKE